jgi:hypothetical protein
MEQHRGDVGSVPHERRAKRFAADGAKNAYNISRAHIKTLPIGRLREMEVNRHE